MTTDYWARGLACYAIALNFQGWAAIFWHLVSILNFIVLIKEWLDD